MPRRVIFRDTSAGTREKGLEGQEPGTVDEKSPAADEQPPQDKPTRKRVKGAQK